MPFKILAIRATKGSNYLKNLQPHVLYRFTSSYHFDGNDDQNGDFRNIKEIQDQSDYPAELYDLVMANNRKLEIHITAVLGKNGSGKSSLLELLYLMVYCLAEKKGYIHDREFDQRQVDRGFNREYFEEYKEQVNLLLKESAIEVYYQLGNDFYVLVNDEKLQLYQLENKKWLRVGYQPDLFFYSIVVNYSLYGLNSFISACAFNINVL